jgi:tRNA(fMet)-specific endonuclease VapC
MLDFGPGAASAYASLPLKRGSFDRLIAAHALSLGIGLVTSNVDDFGDISGLLVEDWTQ